MTHPDDAGRNGGRAAAERELAVHRHLMRFGEADSRVAPVWSASGTNVSSVEAHLAHLWTAPPVDSDSTVTAKGLPHARASVLNLIVTVPEAAAAERVVQTLGGLGYRHPSRALVIVPAPEATGPTLDASVSAHCHAINGGGGSDQVCYEEVVLTVRGEAAEHLNGIVAPLLIHDLPTHAWWPGDPPFADPVFDQLVELADRVIIDSGDFHDLLLGLRRLATLRRRSGIGDLSWRRLAWWQELTAQFFDAPRFRRYLPNLNRIRLRYASDGGAGTGSLAQSMLYAGWFASRLGWRRHAAAQPLRDGALRLVLEGRYAMVDLDVAPVDAPHVPDGELVSVHLQARGEMGAAEFILEREGDETVMASNADGMTALLRRVSMDPPGESELLAGSLMTDNREPVYEAAIRAAAVFLAAARETETAR